jgi:alpha-1,6-mannosyltransferase
VDSRLDALVVQALSFVTCLSFIGHKEWRFIIYVVPLLNVAAARGARTLSVHFGSLETSLSHRSMCSVSLRKGTLFGRFCFGAFVMMLFANSVCTLAYTYISIGNYPGGASLARFNDHYKGVNDGITSRSSI